MPRVLGPSAILLAAALTLGACTGGSDTATTEPSDTQTTGEAVTYRSDVGVQMFQMSWDSVAEQCTQVLGPAGYGWVLVTPPQEHIDLPEWWASYQPVSHHIESRQGTREQFAAMNDACDEAGVQVIADAVINHMSGFESGVGWAGTEFTQYDYPGLFTYDDFHHCGLTPNDDIGDYTDAEQVQNCELLNLADLDTSSEYVRGTLRAYLADLVTLGVDGFRIDAAKHMASGDIGAILSGLPASVWIIQEVIRSGNEPIQPEDYLANGAVFEFAYMREIQGIVRGSSWNYFLKLGTGTGFVPDEYAVPFVTNHDTERNGQALTYKAGADYQLATVLMILQGYGSPMVYTGYSFSDKDAGAPTAADRTVAPAVCAESWEVSADGEWVCAHAWPQVMAAVKFAAVGGNEELVVHYQDSDVLAVGRGSAFAVVNRADEGVTLSVPTGLAAGDYCDLAHDAECAAPIRVDEDGAATVTLGPLDSIVLTTADKG